MGGNNLRKKNWLGTTNIPLFRLISTFINTIIFLTSWWLFGLFSSSASSLVPKPKLKPKVSRVLGLINQVCYWLFPLCKVNHTLFTNVIVSLSQLIIHTISFISNWTMKQVESVYRTCVNFYFWKKSRPPAQRFWVRLYWSKFSLTTSFPSVDKLVGQPKYQWLLCAINATIELFHELHDLICRGYHYLCFLLHTKNSTKKIF